MAARKLLLIDDSASICDLTELLLEMEGAWDVDTAQDGEEGLHLAARDPPDAILLDVQMPGLSGPEVLGRLRRDARTKDIPVIFLSATHADRIDTASLDGVLGIIAKPFDPDDLDGLIRGLLDDAGAAMHDAPAEDPSAEAAR